MFPTYAYDGMAPMPGDMLTPVIEATEQMLAQALAEVRTQIPGASSVLRMGRAADEIDTVIRDTHADLVVMGTHGRKGVRHLLLGSVAEKIVRTSTVLVLTVRGDV